MYQARQTAIDRMTAECAALGGHGVVGVRLSRGRSPSAGWFHGRRHRGSRAGCRARAAGAFYLRCVRAGFREADYSGVGAGRPCARHLDRSRHDDRGLAGQARWWSGNVEVAGWTELVNQSRHDARRRLEQDVRLLGGEGVVITGMQMRVRERDCPATAGRRDHIAEVTLTGTAIARFSRTGQCPAGPALTVMPLGPQHRQAATART
jgi:uncharacterized protein YbjQ (UPF0145 family)